MFFSRTPKPSSFAKIRFQIISRWLLNKDEHCSVIALTSRYPREGVSTVTAGLARSFSSTDTDKILLLDVNAKPSRKARLLDVTRLEDFSDLSDYVTKDRNQKYHRIKLASNPHNSLGIGVASLENELPILDPGFDEDGTTPEQSSDPDMGNESIRMLLQTLKRTYNIILINTGVLINPSGTFWLLNSDINILVIDCSRATRESLEDQQREFENSDISIDGSILNKRKFPIPSFFYWLVR